MVAQTAGAATITVSSTADSGSGSLRAALASASDGDTINFSVTGTILLTSGELLVTKSLSILGPGPDNLALDGNAAGRVFRIGDTVVSISSLTITHGLVAGAGFSAYGGGIYNERAMLTVSNCTLSGNSAAVGGGIYNGSGNTYFNGSVTVVNSTISNNSAATGDGGGIGNDGGTLSIANSTLRGNWAYAGGGIFNGGGTLTVSNSSLSGNSATNGGGIYIFTATVSIANCTFSGNSARFAGGGIFNGGFEGSAPLTIRNSTFSGNSAGGDGGGIYNYRQGDSGTLTVVNCTLSGNSASVTGGIVNFADSDTLAMEIGNTILNAGASGANIGTGGPSGFAQIISLGYNLSSDDCGGFLTATGDQFNTDPLLGPLQDNGGPTFTHALLCGSPAIDKGTNFSGSATDQRGVSFARTIDDAAVPNANGSDGTDIGAFERQTGCNNPPVARCKSVTVPVGSGCKANASIDNGSFDPDGNPITVTQSPAGPYPVGTNVVTLTVTDSHGASNSCASLVIVRDTAPPQLTCPADVTVEFTDAKGTAVSFTPTASDTCSGPPKVVCVPPSGCVFPIGTTTVVCTATDLSGNSAPCRFQVTVLGAQGVKQDVLADLKALRPGLARENRDFNRELEEAIWFLSGSLSPRNWIDQTHLQPSAGERAIGEEALAVHELDELAHFKHSPVSAGALQGLIQRIVKSDRLLANVAIQDAARIGVNSDKILHAGRELAEGDAQASKGQYQKAVEEYQEAWNYVQASGHPHGDRHDGDRHGDD